MISPGEHKDVLEVQPQKKAAWCVVWKRNGTAEFRDCLMSFGISDSPEQAMEKVLRKLRGDSKFALLMGDGIFYPIPTHMGVLNKKVAGV
jgi:hypothetical protein